ncbi:unnamed protein product [Amoebophrya sp. A25]|nr:unnamed protein product [Amoebophrya sp. A25]|eukprot:GSA25T00027574001.1
MNHSCCRIYLSTLRIRRRYEHDYYNTWLRPTSY